MRPRVLMLTDPRYAAHPGEGANSHIQGMRQGFAEHGEVLHVFGDAAARSLRRAAGPGRGLTHARAFAEAAAAKLLASRRFRPDLVYVRHEIPEALTVAALGRSGVPVVLELNALVHAERSDLTGPGRSGRRLLETLMASSATRVVVVSGALGRMVQASLGVDAAKILVCHNAITPAAFEPLAAVQKDPEIIGFVGSDKPWHGLPLLLRAFETVVGARPSARLVLVGGVSEETRRSAARLGTRVRFTGPLPHDRALAEAARFGVAVIPDSNGYASPLKLFEYAALGSPIVAARREPIAEVLDHTTARLVAPGDSEALARALLDLMADPASAAGLGAAARRRVLARHTWSENARRVLASVGLLPAHPAP